MSFIRPEAQATLWRWREALTGIGVMIIGAWWAAGGGELLRYVGLAVGAAGLGLFIAGIQRGRFRGPGNGPGIVQTDEGQIAYFGPLTGGAVALSEMTHLAYDSTAHPGHWVLSQPGQPDLFIPESAEGADALFDIFASLPGLRTDRMIQAKTSAGAQLTEIWRRENAAPRTRQIRLNGSN